MTADVVDLNEKFGLFSSFWSPKLVARLNDHEVKLVKVKGEFVWHTHEDTDELFVVPRGVEHCPRADDEVKALLLEPAGVVNTGDAGGDLTAVVEAI